MLNIELNITVKRKGKQSYKKYVQIQEAQCIGLGKTNLQEAKVAI